MANKSPWTIDKKCAKKGCRKSYYAHYHGAVAANREGWFIQKNGDAWCPDHNPDWVAEWRAKRQSQGEGK